MRPLRFGLALVLLFVAPLAVHAQKPTVAVFPLGASVLTDPSAQAALQSALRDMMITEFGANTRFTAVDRSAVDELLKARNMSLTGQLGDKEASELGRLLGAQYAILGGMTVDATTARMDLRLVDTETALISTTSKERGPKEDLIGIVERVAVKFGENMKVAPRVADVVVPIPSVFAYARGLDYEKRGDRRKAADMYAAALKLFPDNAAAKAALDRVK